MKYSKAGILKKKVGPSSDVLLEESKRMEEQLEGLRDFMQKEKQKRTQKNTDGSYWRSGNQPKTLSNYAELVLSYKPKAGKPSAAKASKAPKPKEEPFVPTSLLIDQPKPKPNLSQFEKSKEKPKDEILEFLGSCGMEKYHPVLIENGIEELEILMELTEEHLTDLKIPLGHRLKILKKIREVKDTEPVLGAPVLAPTPTAVTEMPAVTAPADPEDFRTGEFNEEESSKMFREALENFRNSGSTTQHQPAKSHQDFKKVRFTEPVTEEMLPKSTSNLLYQGNWDHQQTTIETAEDGNDPKEPELKKSCWNCFKVFFEGFQHEEKGFCSQACLQVHLNELTVQCICGKPVIKGTGELLKGKWYCSEECVDAEMEYQVIKIDPATGNPIE